MLKPLVAGVSALAVVFGGVFAWGVYETKAEYNHRVDQVITSEKVRKTLIIDRTVIDDGFFGQVERYEIKPGTEVDANFTLYYENRASFSFMKAEGDFDLDTKAGLVRTLTDQGVLSGLEHTGKWSFDDTFEVSHKTTGFRIDTDDTDASVSPMEQAFYVDRDKLNGEYRLKFGGLLLVRQDKGRFQMGPVRADGFVQVAKSGNLTFPQQNTAIKSLDISVPEGALRVEDILVKVQELEENGFVTLNHELSSASVQVDVKQRSLKATDLHLMASLRHMSRAGYDLVREAAEQDSPIKRKQQMRQAAQMIAKEGMAVDLKDISLKLSDGKSGVNGTLSLKPVDLRDIHSGHDLIPYLGGDLALTIDHQLATVSPEMKRLVRQGVAMGLLKVDKDGNPAMFAELNSGELLVNGKPLGR